MEALAELSDQLGNPGARRLHLEARRRGIQVTRKQVEDLVKRQGQRQIFQPVQPSKGKSAAEGYSARYQADLADMSSLSPARKASQPKFILSSSDLHPLQLLESRVFRSGPWSLVGPQN